VLVEEIPEIGRDGVVGSRDGHVGSVAEMPSEPRARDGEEGVRREPLIRISKRTVERAEHIDLEDGSVDGILCRWAYMLMPDPAAALAESRRVLRPGGRLALAVMGGPAQNPWAASVAMAIVGLGLIPPIDPKASGGVFSLADPDHLRDLLVGAGFDDVRIEEMEFHLRFSDFEDY